MKKANLFFFSLMEIFTKKLISSIALIAVIGIAFSALPLTGCDDLNGNVKQEVTLNGVTFNYNTVKDGYVLYKYSDNDVNVTIPVSVNGKPVIAIGAAAFARKNIKSITIPPSVTSIGDMAFSGCRQLATVTFTGGSQLEYIGRWAFEYNTSLASITIPASVTFIGERAFSYCTDLEQIIVASGNTVYRSEGNCLILNEDNSLIAGFKTSVIPGSVTSIGDMAFFGSSLESLTIPGSVTSIGIHAFTGCTSLTTITIPESVTFIGHHAFYRCTSLTTITIPESITFIDSSVFSDCTSLASITIPASVTFIGFSAFYGCTSLESVIFAYGSQLESIHTGVFGDCTNLTSITIPASVTSMGYQVFAGWTSQQTIIIPFNTLEEANAVWQVSYGAAWMIDNRSSDGLTVAIIRNPSGVQLWPVQ